MCRFVSVEGLEKWEAPTMYWVDVPLELLPALSCAAAVPRVTLVGVDGYHWDVSGRFSLCSLVLCLCPQKHFRISRRMSFLVLSMWKKIAGLCCNSSASVLTSGSVASWLFLP